MTDQQASSDSIECIATTGDNENGPVFETPDGYVTTLVPRPDFRTSAGGACIDGLIERDRRGIAANIMRIRELHPWIIGIADQCADLSQPQWVNDHLPAYDAIALGLMVLIEKPEIVLEIGSGNSTRFLRSVISFLGLDTRIISVDPAPRAEIDALCDHVIRRPLEQADHEVVRILKRKPLVFFDGSHRLLPNSDVSVFFTELLPAMAPGTVYGIHDIYLPFDYNPTFTARLYTEQYVLAAYLLGGGGGDRIELPLAYLTSSGDFAKALPLGKQFSAPNGEGFWLRRSVDNGLLARLKRILRNMQRSNGQDDRRWPL
jgi:hypothetical protein